jgi:hypothetical protein
MANPAQIETGRTGSRTESLRDVTPVNRKVYLLVVSILGVALVSGIAGWLVLTFTNRQMPEGLAVIVGTIAGGLVGLISGKDGG